MFHWDKMYKHEENIERDVTERVEEYVKEFYNVDSIFDLTDDQINELDNFRNNDISEYSVMQIGFSNLINDWENEEYDDEEEWDDE